MVDRIGCQPEPIQRISAHKWSGILVSEDDEPRASLSIQANLGLRHLSLDNSPVRGLEFHANAGLDTKSL